MSITDPHAPRPSDSMPTTDTVGGESSLGAHVGLDDAPQRCVLIAVDERDESVDTARAALRLMGPNARYVLLNAQYLFPARERKPTPEGNVVYRTRHPLEFLPYQYEGYVAAERALLRETDIAIRLVDTKPE